MGRYRNLVNEVTMYHCEDRHLDMPGISVKSHSFPRTWFFESLGLDEDTAGPVGEKVWEECVAYFWMQADNICRDIYGDRATVLQCGRSGGWLCVDGLPEVISWRKIWRGRWFEFEKKIHELFVEVNSKEFVKAMAVEYMEEMR